MPDIGLTHIALPVRDIDASIAFYEKYARMQVVHRRTDPATGGSVAWISDRTRPFVVVLMTADPVHPVLLPYAHLGVGCASRDEVDELCAIARANDCLEMEPADAGYPVGYFALLRDPDGHTLELAFGQEVGLTVETK
jgi:catechol 2,3-dioxygenase-like lactoylglutathione lyase family enzyme